MPFEYRVCWNASSNIIFEGASDWEEWHDNEDTVEDIQNELELGNQLCDGLELALSFSGFEWWVETREIER